MSSTASLKKLTELASETSSERRRELLRDVTDLYFANQNTCSTIENEHFDEILCHVTSEMQTEVRKEMALKFASKPKAPLQLLRQLANDEIDIAGPVLKHSAILQDQHLQEIITSGKQQHMQMISTRETLSAEVTSDLVEHANDQTLVKLASNSGARFNRQSMQKMVSKSETVTALQAPLVEHEDLPADLMNEMYMFAEKKVRERILTRNQEIDPKVLEEALSKVKNKTIDKTEQRPEGYQKACFFIDAIHAKGQLDGVGLIKFERANERLSFTLGLAKLANVDYGTIDRVLQRDDVDALALICRGIGFDAAMFVTITLLVSRSADKNTGIAADLREAYTSIPEDAAKRTLRFWQVRQKLETAQSV
ncbi:MAG: DUF2336 domain-containing protein [Robiginitomaculum sp.]|nr:DUF2336 domain-containing protein [Robiginitomaculum sp.]